MLSIVFYNSLIAKKSRRKVFNIPVEKKFRTGDKFIPKVRYFISSKQFLRKANNDSLTNQQNVFRHCAREP